MRKGIADGSLATIPLSTAALEKAEAEGFKYFQVKGLTADKHYDYIDPHFLILVPMRELPTDPNKKDIYEPVKSPLLQQWANDGDHPVEVVIASRGLAD
jgi:hypothetical protein